MKKTIINLIAIAAVFSISLCSCNNNSDSDKNTSEKSSYTASDEPIQAFSDYFDAFFSSDADTVVNLTTPSAYLDEMKANGTYNTLVTQTQDIMIKYSLDSFKEKYGDDVSIVLKEQLNSTPLTAEQLNDALECYKASYGAYKSQITIAEGYEITYTYIIGGSKSSEEISETACFVKPENDCWKMLPVTAETLKGFNNAQSLLDQQ